MSRQACHRCRPRRDEDPRRGHRRGRHGIESCVSARRRSTRRRSSSTRSSRSVASCASRRRRGGRVRRSRSRRHAHGRRARRRQHRRSTTSRLREVLERGSACRSALINDGSAAALAEFAHGAGRGTRRPRAAHARDGRRRRVRARRPALSRLGRGRAHGDRRGRRALPGGLHRPRARRVVLLRARGRPARAARCSAPTATARDLVEQRHPALAEIGRHLGVAIASLVNLFDPDVVVIGGGFGVAAGELLLGPARERDAARGARAGGGDACGSCVAELGPTPG